MVIRNGSPPVIIISEAAERRYFGNADSLGAVINGKEVVGVVKDVRSQWPEADSRATVYVPVFQSSVTGGDLLVRVTSPMAAQRV